MATVRRWQRQAETAPLAPPSPVERDTSGLRALAQGVGQVADAAAAISSKELADARRTREAAAANQLRSARVTLEDAAGQAKGRTALEVDLLGAATKELQAQADKLAEEAGDPALAEQIRLHHKDQEFQLTHSIRTHISGQADAFALQTHKDALEGADLDAARAAEINDYGGVLAAAERKAGAIRREASRLGRDGAADDYLRTELPAQLGLLHANVIATLNGGTNPQPRKAALYLNAHRSEMSPALAAKIEKDLLSGAQAEAGSDHARRLVSEATNGAGRFDLASAQARLTTLLADPGLDFETKKALASEFDAAAHRADRAWSAKVTGVAESAITLIQRNGYSLAAAKEAKAWLQRDDVAGGRVWDGIVAHVRGMLRESQGQGETVAQQSAYTDFLLSLPTNLDRYAARPELLKQEWMGRLSPRDLERAAGAIVSPAISARKPDETLPTYITHELTLLGHEAGLWPKKGPQTAEAKVLFYQLNRELLNVQAEQRAQNGGKFDPEKLLEYARKRMRMGRLMGSGIVFDTEVTEIEAATLPEYSRDFFIPSIEEDRYKEELAKKGLPTTDEWVKWTHRKVLGVPDEANPFPLVDKRSLEKQITDAGNDALLRVLNGEVAHTQKLRNFEESKAEAAAELLRRFDTDPGSLSESERATAAGIRAKMADPTNKDGAIELLRAADLRRKTDEARNKAGAETYFDRKSGQYTGRTR